MSEVNKQVTQSLAEAFNLMAAASFDGIKGAELSKAGAVMVSFQSVIQALSDGQLVVSEPEEAKYQEPGLGRIIGEEDTDETA